MRHAYKVALVSFVVALPLLMAPTGGIPSRPQFSSVGIGAAAPAGTGAAVASSTGPRWDLNETDGAANNRRWQIAVNAEQFKVRVADDALSSTTDAITIDRTANVVDSIALNGTAITANGSTLVSTLNGATDTAPIGWTKISKTATTSRNTTTTLTADPELQISPAAGTVRLEFCFIFNATTSGAGGYKFAMNRLSAGSAFQQWWGSRAASGTVSFFAGQGVAGPGSTSTLVTAATTAVASSRDYACGNGILVAQGGTTYAIEWAQNTSDANNLNLLAGSWIRYQLVF